MYRLKLPFDIMFKVDWHGWLVDNKVPGNYSINHNVVVFDEQLDLLAFRMRFNYYVDE